MNICIPVEEEKGLQSPVCAHFGSAPAFLIVDTDTGECRAIQNRNEHHAHGMCQPLAALEGQNVGGVVVGGIGVGAVVKLRQAGVEVFLSRYTTVDETLSAFKAGTLEAVSEKTACGGHAHGGGGHHGHGGGHGCG